MIKKLRAGLDRLPDLVASPRVRESSLQVLPFWVAGALTGLVAVGYAKAFVILEQHFNTVSLESPWMLFVIPPLAFLGSWALVVMFSPEASGSGIPQLMAATTPSVDAPIVHRLLSIRAAIVKVLSSCLAVAGGGAIGREGPTLQISGAIFRAVQVRLPAFWPRVPMSSMVLAGGAAGLAAAFNTPLGGIVYVIEELSRTHIGAFRSGVLHAVLVAGIVSQVVLGPYLYLGFPRLGVWTNQELPWCALMGALAGLVGSLWSRGLFSVVRFRARLSTIRQEAGFALACGAVLSILVVLAGRGTMGSGRGVIEDLLFQTTEPAGAGLVIGRLAGSFVSFAAGGAGGVFAPALASGAALASALAPAFSTVEPRLLIVLGMVGFLTGVTRTPFTSFVLVLEMTDRHSALFPMMIAAMSAYATSHLVDHESFYERVRATILAAESPAPKGHEEARQRLKATA
ncbi:MAG: chloride channel protein [Vicinamibacteria bacterium]|nr:chloride channel protein [Vicinamibacteria bacterium]